MFSFFLQKYNSLHPGGWEWDTVNLWVSLNSRSTSNKNIFRSTLALYHSNRSKYIKYILIHWPYFLSIYMYACPFIFLLIHLYIILCFPFWLVCLIAYLHVHFSIGLSNKFVYIIFISTVSLSIYLSFIVFLLMPAAWQVSTTSVTFLYDSGASSITSFGEATRTEIP